jgi:hypothetical protein
VGVWDNNEKVDGFMRIKNWIPGFMQAGSMAALCLTYSTQGQNLTTLLPSSIPDSATFWLQTGGAPLPFNPFAEYNLPVYAVGGSSNTFVIDDTQWLALQSELNLALEQSDISLDPGEGGGGTNEYNSSYISPVMVPTICG